MARPAPLAAAANCPAKLEQVNRSVGVQSNSVAAFGNAAELKTADATDPQQRLFLQECYRALEDAGYDKRTDANTIHRLHRAAIDLVPALQNARILEDWAGLRPGTPDDLPILGETRTPGYFVAAGHFRDGILLTPVTAHVMAQVLAGAKPDCDLSAFSPARFFSQYFFTQASQLLPAAGSRPVKATPAISE